MSDNASYDIQLNLIKEYIDRFGFSAQGVWELIQVRPADKNFAAVAKAFIEENYSQELKAYVDDLLNKVAESLRQGTELSLDLRYLGLLGQQDQVNILNNVRSSYNENTLIYALRKHPQMVAPLLDVISGLPEEEQKEIFNVKMSAQDVKAEGCNALAVAYRYQPQAGDSLIKTIGNLTPANQLEIFKTTRERTNLSMQWQMLNSMVLNQPKAISPLLEALTTNRGKWGEEDLQYTLKYKNENHYSPLMLAARYKPEALPPLLEAIRKMTPEDRIYLFNGSDLEGNVLSIAVQYQPESVALLLKFVFSLPPKEQNKIEMPELKNIIPLLKRESLEQLGEIKGSSVLFDLFATQTHEDKQRILNFSLTKFLFSLCHDKDSEQIKNDFRQLISFANTPRNIFSLKKDNTASCDDLIKKLSQVGEKEKEKLTDALGLAIDGKDKSPKAFAVALEKYIATMPKGAEPCPEKNSNSPGFH